MYQVRVPIYLQTSLKFHFSVDENLVLILENEDDDYVNPENEELNDAQLLHQGHVIRNRLINNFF